jgi:hypothetical protein
MVQPPASRRILQHRHRCFQSVFSFFGYLFIFDHALERPVEDPHIGRGFRISDLNPRFARARPIRGGEPLRHDALQPELARRPEHIIAVALQVLDVLDAIPRPAEQLFQFALTL